MTPWGKYIYVIALFIAGMSGLNWLHYKIFYFEGVGYLESVTKLMEAPVTGRIVDIRCNINDEVTEGQALVFLSHPRYVYSMNRDRGASADRYARDAAKIIDAESRLDLFKYEIQQSKDDLFSLKVERRKGRELLAIQVITRSELSNIELQLRKLEHEIKLLQIKYEAAVKVLDLYTADNTFDNGVNFQTGTARLPDGILNSPAEGVVSEIFKQKGEVAKVGEAILRINEKGNNFIKTYFTGKHEDGIDVGDKAWIIFADGERSTGVIRQIYPTASDQPKQLKNRFGAAQRYIIAEIVREDGKPWERILETEVTVRMKKKWF